MHWWSFGRWRIRKTAYSTHATLEADIIHFVNGLTGILHDSEVTVLVHRRNLALKPIHEIRCLCRLPRLLFHLVLLGQLALWLGDLHLQELLQLLLLNLLVQEELIPESRRRVRRLHLDHAGRLLVGHQLLQLREHMLVDHWVEVRLSDNAGGPFALERLQVARALFYHR